MSGTPNISTEALKEITDMSEIRDVEGLEEVERFWRVFDKLD